jgi:hypothetical protein
MRIYFSGVGEANHIHLTLEHPTCPRIGENVEFSSDDSGDEWTVRTVVHTPNEADYDVYVCVGTAPR